MAAAQHHTKLQLCRRRADLVENQVVGGVVPNRRHHHADGAGALKIQIPGGHVGRVAQFFGNFPHPLLGCGRDVRRVPQRLGHRHMGQPRQLPDGL